MKKVWLSVFALSLAAASGCGPSEYADRYVERSEDNIVGGTKFVGLPAVGTLLYDGNQHCTGTLIGKRTVLTAAHCVDGFTASRMQFGIGPSLSSLESVVAVKNLRRHPAYNAQSIANDIATVELTSDAPVEPMPVAQTLGQGDVGADFLFVGYGLSNGIKGTGAGTKRAVWIEISELGDTQFAYSDVGKNTCNGDSGGPAFVERNGELQIAGVTSFGDSNCTQYGVDTRVDAFLDFLGLPADVPASASSCEGETFTGRCDGDVVVWCENGAVKSGDCAPAGQTCGFSQTKGYYACH